MLALLVVGCARRPAAFVDGIVVARGASLHLHCMGAGEPTVLLDAGLGDDGSTWGDVHYAVAKTTRACVYDRAGLGYSGPPPSGSRSSSVLVAELEAAIASAQITGPWVLVGHSFGGLDMQLLAQTRGAAGLVLLDAMSADQDVRYWALLPPTAHEDFAKSLAGSPERLDHAALVASMAEVRASRKDLGTMPLVVLSHGKAAPSHGLPDETARAMDVAWSSMQGHLAKLSRNSVHIIEKESGHYLQRDAPALVIAAISETCRAARAPDGLIAARLQPR